MPPRIPQHLSALSTPSLRSKLPIALTPTLTRNLHGSAPPKPIPAPTPFVPDVATFLRLIGRDTAQHASKFPSWESFFQNQSSVLRTSGIEPARTRRYLLWWRERYRQGLFGFGGDLKEVIDGTAEVRIAERDGRKVVVNSRPGDGEAELRQRPVGVRGVKIVQPGVLDGPFVKPRKGSWGAVATVSIVDGMWEEKRGHKVKGGERKRKLMERVEKRKKDKEERDKALGLA